LGVHEGASISIWGVQEYQKVEVLENRSFTPCQAQSLLPESPILGRRRCARVVLRLQDVLGHVHLFRSRSLASRGRSSEFLGRNGVALFGRTVVHNSFKRLYLLRRRKLDLKRSFSESTFYNFYWAMRRNMARVKKLKSISQIEIKSRSMFT
jgi:hypothetical protein